MSTNLADRIWFAIHCLPRDERGQPPAYKTLERQVKLSQGTFSKLMLGERHKPSPETLLRIARVLHVSTDWLLSGEGKEPIPTGMVPPRLPYLVEKGDDPKEPFNVETLQSVSVAVQLVYSAAQEDPTASPLELLLRAQIAALKQHK